MSQNYAERYGPKKRPTGQRTQMNVRVRKATSRDFKRVVNKLDHSLDDCADRALAFVATQPEEWQRKFFEHLPKKHMGAKLRL